MYTEEFRLFYLVTAVSTPVESRSIHLQHFKANFSFSFTLYPPFSTAVSFAARLTFTVLTFPVYDDTKV
jgi:hypothetical protein